MARQWLPTWVINEQFQVAHDYNGQQFIVDTAKKICSCNFWELVGIPCRHAVAAIGYSGKNPIDFVDACYSREMYAACYGFAISAINGVDMWPKPCDGVEEKLLPPMYKRGPGRPKKLRIREFDEDGVRKARKGTYHCTKCGDPGHNTMSCKSKDQDLNALKRKRKPPKGKASGSGSGEGKGKSKANAPTDGEGKANASGPVDAAPVDASQANALTDVAASQASMVVDASQASMVVDASQANAPIDVAASQASTVVDAGQDLFDDIPDEVMASIPEIIGDALKKKPDQNKLKDVKIEKVKDVKPKAVKLYHGQKRRSSERIQMNCLKKPITGVGSSQTQPI